ncbi:MAG: hypothetical protein OHK0022_42620 [Roseiflexaceae bacterium]
MATPHQRRTVLATVLLLAALILGGLPGPASARNSPFTQKGSGPLYWSTYGYNFPYDAVMPESLWQSNLDWVANNFKNAGYTMVATDGWVGTGAVNSNGYTAYYANWTHDWAYWANYATQRGLKLGIYWNPTWISQRAVDQNNIVQGTSGIRVQDIKGPQQFAPSPNDGLGYWQVDISKPGAEQWVKGNVNYFKNMGIGYLRIDFLRDLENRQGSAAYATALRWMHEAAGDSMFLSLVMPNCYNDCATELLYGDMIRVSEDTFQDRSNMSGWSALSDRRRTSYGQPARNNWPQFDNAWDGLAYFSKIAGKGKMILDGDFLIMSSFANDAERKTALSLFTIAGSPITIADYCTGSACTGSVAAGAPADFYRNPELVALSQDGLVGRPLKGDSQRWVGQLSDGSLVVGLFNREGTTQTRSINYSADLGLSGSFATRDLWARASLGTLSSYSVNLAAHDHRLIKISGAGIAKPWNPPATSAFGRIEAERDAGQSGTCREATGDTGAGLNIGCTDNGDFLKYERIDFGTGAASVAARVATSSAGGTVEFRLDSVGGPLIAAVNVSNTGGWQTWTTASATVSGASGVRDLYVVFKGNVAGISNLNWFQFNASSGGQVFFDDFEDGDSNGWTSSGGSWAVCQVGGNSREYCKSDTGAGLTTAGSSWTNYSVQAYITQSDTNGNAALLARVQDANRFYQLELKNDGGVRRWAIWKNNAGAWSEIAKGDYAYAAGSYYLLRFTVQGSTLSASISTDFGQTFQPLGSGSDSTFASGRIGLRSSSTTARFDQVRVITN